ncbi:DUF2273 domain-containing protein [Kurthia massiliensis]|uniref:DUF2273 domain-containing protein n=1 Tax=Kurthia massiliensis TaxID=1033739 RepID=UPI000287A6D9|nr:DUF2273 domain-containing protein [Kurthia massiliensis]
MQEEHAATSFLRTYKWRIIGCLTMILIAILFLTLGFWKTILIIALGALGVGIGYAKDRTAEFLTFIDKLR